MVVLKNVWKRFCYRERGRKKQREITALRNISFSVPEGEVVGIVGASGAGKTSLLKVLCGLLKPEQGLVRVMGAESVGERKKIRRNIAVLFTGAGVLEPGASVEKNLEIAGFVYRKGDREVWEEMKELCALFSIDGDVMKMSVKELSLGQKRRVELVYLFIQKAELYLLDEPCIGLDAQAKQAFQERIAILKKAGKTVCISSHDLAEIDHICSRILVLREGGMLYYGKKEGIYEKYAPLTIMTMQLSEWFPDFEDLPVKRYEIQDGKLKIFYDGNCVKTAEILKVLWKQEIIQEISVKTLTLEEMIILSAKEEEKNGIHSGVGREQGI